MAESIEEEHIQKLVRDKLNQDKVKLWLPPYTTEDGQKGTEPLELIAKYSKELGLSETIVADAAEKLRSHALEKLAAKRQFEASGIATLKIKLAGNIPGQSGKKKDLSVEVSLTFRGSDLRNKIAEESQIGSEYLKLVAQGHVIDDQKNLLDQGVKNGTQIMVIILGESEAEAIRNQAQASRVAKTREAAQLLSSKEDGGDNENYYLQIADQNGRPIQLPKEERKALVFAMTLHEKGRACMKRKDYGEAVLLLLDADEEFKKCRSSILDMVDNYAVLSLDIVWCYLCLKNINDLPDAERRLNTCDMCFRKSYGPNLERLAIVKGNSGTEKALFMRLHLLQGILAFHQNKGNQAMQLISRAENELRLLQVDEDKITQVASMGFTIQEARLGLRACEGSVPVAVEHIMKKREDKKERLAKEKEEKRQKRVAKSLGNCANGDLVNVEHYEQLLSMGFPKGGAAEALKQTNNDLLASIQVLQEQPDLLSLPDPEPSKSSVTDEMLSQVTAMGFSLEVAQATLHRFSADVPRAIEELLKLGGMVPQEWLDAAQASLSSSESSSASASSGSESSSPTESTAEQDREKELIESIIPDIPENEEDYLDLTLEEETQFLHEYKAYLQSL